MKGRRDWNFSYKTCKLVKILIHIRIIWNCFFRNQLWNVSFFSVYYNDEWNVRYIRQCAPSGEVGPDEGRECSERTGTYRVKMRYCHCDNQDGCNGAESVNIPMISMILPALTTIGLFRKL